MIDLLFFIPVLYFLIIGWVGVRAANRVIREAGPDARMIYPVQRHRGLIERSLGGKPPTMSALTARRIGVFFMLLSPLPLGFGLGWHVFNPAHWWRQTTSPCREIVPEAVVKRRLETDVNVDVEDWGDHCSLTYGSGGRIRLRLSIEARRSRFAFEEKLAAMHNNQIVKTRGPMRKGLPVDDHVRLVVLSGGYVLNVELLSPLNTDVSEGAIRRAITKNMHRIDLDAR